MRDVLLPLYGLPTLGNKADPLDELIFIVLSQRTAGSQFERQFDALKAAYPTWDAVLADDPGALEGVLRGGGLGNKRAAWIRGLLLAIQDLVGTLSLACLAGMSDAAGERFLCELPGVGQKTARCVLMYSLCRDVFPVDVHARRILYRLGCFPSTVPRGELHAVADTIVPKRLRRDLHILFVVHGRSVCRPVSPRCSTCAVRQQCPRVGVQVSR